MKIKPLSAKYSDSWWKQEITRATELDKRKQFIETAEESIRIYNAKKNVGILNDVERRLNVWWYCTNTLLPAFYSSTPKAEVNLRKRTGGLKYQLGAVILERNIQYSLDQYFNFDEVGYLAALQFLLTGQGVLWARYDAKFEKQVQSFSIIRDPSGNLIDGLGQPYTGSIESATEEGGIITIEQEIEVKTDEKAILDLVHYTDYFTNDARSPSEIEWQARRAYMDRQDVEVKFGADVAKKLNYTSFPESIKRDLRRNEPTSEGKAEIFEIWCEKTNKVYWLSKDADTPLLEVSEPPIKFDKFYPCSVIRQSVDPESVIPVSDYAHCKDQILEIERLTTRIHAVTQAIRTNAVYDAAIGSMVQELMTGDLKLSPVNNWPSYKNRGGIANSIEFLNIEPFIQALGQLQQARELSLNQLYETLKVSDLLRGTSDQYKSATANRLESQWSSLGLIVRQNMFTKFVSDAIANIGAIISQQFDESVIAEVGDAYRLLKENLVGQPALPPPMPPGAEGQAAPMPEPQILPPADDMTVQASLQEIMAVFRDQKERCYRIEIASDSMVAIDQQQQQKEGAMLMETAGQFFQQMQTIIQEYPPLTEFAISLFQNMIKRYKGGKEVDGLFTKALQGISEIAKAKEEAAKQPPPPDPVTQEMQYRMQIAQIESQARLQAVQMEMQDKAVKNQLAMQDQQLQSQREQVATQLEIQKQRFDEYYKQQELVIRQQEVQIKATAEEHNLIKIQADNQKDAVKAEITVEKNRMDAMMEMQRQQLDKMAMQLSETEKLMEERRLASELAIEKMRLAMDQLKTTKEVQGSAPSIEIKKNRKGKLQLDDDGNFSLDLMD